MRVSSCGARPSRLRLVGHPAGEGLPRANDIPDDIGTAVNVVQMVFGNKGDELGHGRCFTRDPSTGERASTASSSRTRRARTSWPAPARRSRSRRCATCCPRPTTQLLETMRRLEEHYRDVQDIEFTVEDGALYMLQTRAGEAHGSRRAQGRDRHGRGGPDHARGGRRPDRPLPARPAAPSDDRPHARDVEVAAKGLNASPGRSERRDRLRRRHRRRARARTAPRDPRPLGDDARTTSTA